MQSYGRLQTRLQSSHSNPPRTPGRRGVSPGRSHPRRPELCSRLAGRHTECRPGPVREEEDYDLPPHKVEEAPVGDDPHRFERVEGSQESRRSLGSLLDGAQAQKAPQEAPLGGRLHGRCSPVPQRPQRYEPYRDKGNRRNTDHDPDRCLARRGKNCDRGGRGWMLAAGLGRHLQRGSPGVSGTEPEMTAYLIAFLPPLRHESRGPELTMWPLTRPRLSDETMNRPRRSLLIKKMIDADVPSLFVSTATFAVPVLPGAACTSPLRAENSIRKWR